MIDPAIENNTCNGIANFILGTADDVLSDLYVCGKYRDVIAGSSNGLDMSCKASYSLIPKSGYHAGRRRAFRGALRRKVTA